MCTYLKTDYTKIKNNDYYTYLDVNCNCIISNFYVRRGVVNCDAHCYVYCIFR